MKTTIFILCLLLLGACSKEPTPYPFDPDCGVIETNQQMGDIWYVVYKWNDGTRDTILWHFDIVSQEGDTICKLKEIDLDDFNCKP